MSVAKHKDGFFVSTSEERDGKALCKYMFNGEPKEEWLDIADLIAYTSTLFVIINNIKDGKAIED